MGRDDSRRTLPGKGCLPRTALPAATLAALLPPFSCHFSSRLSFEKPRCTDRKNGLSRAFLAVLRGHFGRSSRRSAPNILF